MFHTQFCHKESGLSLIETLVVMGIAATFVAVFIFAFNDDSSKGKEIYLAANSITKAALRFNLTTSCYPGNTGELFKNPITDGQAANNSCDTSISQWTGPYSKPAPLDANRNVILSTISHNTHLTVQNLGVFGGVDERAITVTGIPNAEFAKYAALACGSETGAESAGGYPIYGGHCILETNGNDSAFGVALTAMPVAYSDAGQSNVLGGDEGTSFSILAEGIVGC